jgi:hypothetical protein
VRRGLTALPFLALFGCGGSHPAVASPRPLGEDLIALLPSGADVILDVDVEQLRTWDSGRRLFLLLPEDARARIARLGADPLSDVDQVVMAVAQAGTKESASTVVLRGDIDLSRARQALGLQPEGEYHGRALAESDDSGEAAAQLGPRLYAFGSKVDVRRVIDLALGGTESVRASRIDQSLRAALEHAPTAKVGRPALMAAVVGTDALKARLRAESMPSEFLWLAVSLAVGDGFDVGAIAGFPGPAEANDLVRLAKRELEGLSARPLVRALGLQPFIDPVQLVSKEGEVHLAYRLGEERVERLVSRFEAFAKLPGLVRPSAPAPSGGAR